MLPRGFLGTRADILADLVVLSLAVIVPALAGSWALARRGKLPVHRAVQITLAIVLAVAVGLFETDLELSGGMMKLFSASRFAGSRFLVGSVGVHLTFAFSTSLLWAGLIFLSLRRFPRPLAAGAFSPAHRLLGRLGMIDMLLTGVTGVALYVIGFAL